MLTASVWHSIGMVPCKYMVCNKDMYGILQYYASKGLVGLHARIRYAFEQGYGMQQQKIYVIRLCLYWTLRMTRSGNISKLEP